MVFIRTAGEEIPRFLFRPLISRFPLPQLLQLNTMVNSSTRGSVKQTNKQTVLTFQIDSVFSGYDF